MNHAMDESWLTEELKQKVRNVFEPKYKRKLTEDEITEIANNLTDFIEHYLRFKQRQQNEEKIKINHKIK